MILWISGASPATNAVLALSRAALHNRWVIPLAIPPPSLLNMVAGEPVSIAFLGTSITEGAGARGAVKTSWPAFPWQFSDFLQSAFPESNITVHYLGEGGSTPHFWEACSAHLLPPQVSLLQVCIMMCSWKIYLFLELASGHRLSVPGDISIEQSLLQL